VRAVMESVYGTFPTKRFAVMGNANLDPARGAGDRGAIAAFLADRRVQDLRPQSALGGEATAFWDKPGPMRVSYILPSAEWQVDRAEVVWPQTGLLRTAAEQASRHRMIWLELRPPP
ncbi:MAG: endonuclease/exonuclease/phosphatase family protein, partial [Planktotalea arctica]